MTSFFDEMKYMVKKSNINFKLIYLLDILTSLYHILKDNLNL